MTLAHPAIVLPLRRIGLPLSALSIGAMAPDLPLFVTSWPGGYWSTHSWHGVLGVDLAVTLALLFVWDRLLRDALVDLSPDVVRDRLPAHARLARSAWLLAPVAAWIGSASHVFWDSFTHGHRWGVEHIAWLEEQHGPLPGHQWLQHICGVVGFAVVLAAMALHLRAQPAPTGPRRPRALPVWVVPAGLGVVAVLALVWGALQDGGLHQFAYDVVVSAIGGGALVVLLACIAWRARRELA